MVYLQFETNLIQPLSLHILSRGSKINYVYFLSNMENKIVSSQRVHLEEIRLFNDNQKILLLKENLCM